MDDAHFMKLALQEAKKAMEEEEVPVVPLWCKKEE